MSFLDDVWNSAWLGPVVVAIVTTAISAYLTLRGNIREKAWLVVYEEKRREIRELLSALDEFASTIVTGCEVVALKERTPADQAAMIAFLVRQRFGPDGESRDSLPKAIMDFLPEPALLFSDPASAKVAESLEFANRTLRNSLDSDLQGLNVRVRRLLTTLSLSLRDPALIEMAHNPMDKAYAQVHATSTSFSRIDANEFAGNWSTAMTPIKLALRRDLEKSSRSLGAATRLSWRWRLKRTRSWKLVSNLRSKKGKSIADRAAPAQVPAQPQRK